LSGKPGNVGQFDSFREIVMDFTKSQGSVREKILSGKSWLKLFIVGCIFVYIQVFNRVYTVLDSKYMVLDHALLLLLPPPLTVSLLRA